MQNFGKYHDLYAIIRKYIQNYPQQMYRNTCGSSCTEKFFVSVMISTASIPDEDRSKSELLADGDILLIIEIIRGITFHARD